MKLFNPDDETSCQYIDRLEARVEQLEAALRNVEIEAMREGGRWPHLKRVVALQCRDALSDHQ